MQSTLGLINTRRVPPMGLY